MAKKAAESLKNNELIIEPNHYHNQWLLWLDNSKYVIKMLFLGTNIEQNCNIFLEIGAFLDNSGGVIDYHYLKLNMVGFLHTIWMKL